MKATRYFGLLSSLVFLTLLGCQSADFGKCSRLIGPDYVNPGAEVARDWIDFNSPEVISDANAVCDEQWWTVFGDSNIEEIVLAANSKNLPLQAALLQIKEQHHQRAIAVGNLFPRQEAFAEYQRQQFSDNGNQFGIPGLGNSFDFYQMGFNSSWEIDLWGRLRRLIEAASAEVEVSAEDEKDIRLSLTADVISAYTEIRTFQQRIENAKEQIAAQEETLRIANSKFKNGSESKLDVNQAEATLEFIKSTVPGLESELRHSNNRLCLQLGIPPRDLTTAMGPSTIPSTPDSVVVGMPRDLLRRRPDIRRAERFLAQQCALIGVAKADLYPAFSLRGTINWQAFAFSDLFSSASNAGAIIPGVRWQILNFGRIKNRILAQETRYQQAVLVYRQTVLNANTEVENSLNGFLNKKKQVASLEKAVEATRESLRIGTKQYEAGSIEFDRLNDLRKELVDQLDGLAVEEGKAALFLIKVYKTMGGGWTFPHETQGYQHCAQGSICQSIPLTYANPENTPPVQHVMLPGHGVPQPQEFRSLPPIGDIPTIISLPPIRSLPPISNSSPAQQVQPIRSLPPIEALTSDSDTENQRLVRLPQVPLTRRLPPIDGSDLNVGLQLPDLGPPNAQQQQQHNVF